MPYPALGRKKPHPLSTNQDESSGRDHQSQNPQQQIYGGIHSDQREHAGEVVNSTQHKQPQQLPDPSPDPSKQHHTPDKDSQHNTKPIYPSYGQSSQPPGYPPLPTPQQQSNPFTPPRNDPTRAQDLQSINLTFLIYPAPQNTENQPPQLPTQQVILPTYNKPPDAHKQPQPTPNIPRQAPSPQFTEQEEPNLEKQGHAFGLPPGYPPPGNQISTYNKHPDQDTAHEQPNLKKPGNAPGPPPWYPHPRNQIQTKNKYPDEDTTREQLNLKKTGQASGPPPGYPPPRSQIPMKYKPPDEDTYSKEDFAKEVDDPSKQHPIPVKNATQQDPTMTPLKESPIYPPCGQISGDLNKPEHVPLPHEQTTPKKPGQPPPGYPIHKEKQAPPPKKKENGCCTIL